jgi:hypothetical protein
MRCDSRERNSIIERGFEEDDEARRVAHLTKLAFVAFIFVAGVCLLPPTRATEPPADACSLLTVDMLNKETGQTYDAPKKSVAPRPFPNTVEGTDCTYKKSKGGNESKLLFRIYADPSPAAAADLFAKLSKYYPGTPVKGVGDQAYIDKNHGLHVLKGKVRFFLQMGEFNASTEKQLQDLATQIAGKL